MASDEEVIQEITTLSRQLSKTKTERDVLRAQVKELESDLDVAEARSQLSTRLAGHTYKPPTWLTRKPKKSSGVVCTILSDTHFDEIVRPEEIGFRNEYDRKIAVKRLKSYFQKVILLTKDYITGINYEGCVLFLGGDIFSGDIHEELTETNEDTMLGSVIFWTEQIQAGINLLAEHFDYVHIPCVVGNHGRRTRRPRMKLRARDNFDWFLYQTLEERFKDNKKVTFDVASGADLMVDVQDTTYLLTHGDQARGGGGIGGIWPPLMRLVARKRNNTDFDYMVLGHFHQLIMAPSSGFLLNGSLKGYDEFAAIENFAYEIPQQALWINVPDKGILWQTALLVED
ncbi:hypothetical protein CMI37_03940 [Candidatus Pacearchaeota archaeon]|nr:hypothetical protein [Candidatus Pacearchaeota archaeon]